MKKPSPKSVKKSQRKKTKLANIHDEFVRAVFAHLELVIEFLKFYVGKTHEGRKLLKLLDLKRIRLEPTHFCGEEGRQRIADLIFWIPLKSGKGSAGVVFVFEHKSERKRSWPFQLLKYLVAFWNQFFSESPNPESPDFKLPAPLLMVLYNGSKPIINKPMLEDYIEKVIGTKQFIPNIDYILVDLPALTPEELGKAPLLRVILELLKRATDGTLYDVRKQILEPLAAIRDDEKTRYWIQQILQYMDKAIKSKKKELTPETIDEIIKPVYKERSTKMSLTFLEKLEARGEARGKAIGEAIGEAIGRAIGEQDMILAILRNKFAKVPAKIETSIRGISDSIVLESLCVHAASSRTLKEFA
ncbi:MAG: Rpn family recombination-promoting nuclease/putative transposase, partial [Planctomycetaceae bacterium]|nr:Rpn family recombination-promoting nuclease/putative transposase [Planctomycetaceae bacterium]